MAIISNTFGLLGQEGVTPRRVQMVVTDSLASITTAGYLQFAGVNTNQIQTTDIFDIIYLFSTETHTGTYGEFVPSFSPSLVITLVQVGGSTNGTVDTGTANDLAYYEVTGTTVSPLSTADNAVLITSGAGVPSLSHLIPSAVQLQIGSFDSGTGASSSSFWRGDGQWVASPGSGTVNTGTINDLAFYASTGVAVSPLTTADNGVLITSVGGVPSISSTLPSELTIPSPIINQINDTNGNEILGFIPVASAVNYFAIAGAASGIDLTLTAGGTDTNIGIRMYTKGTGLITIGSTNTALPVVFSTGTANQHNTYFAFANTAASRTVTFPDASGTISLLGNTTTGTGDIVLENSPTINAPIINQIDDTNGNQILGFVAATSAVNFIEILNNSTGLDPIILAAGADSNLNFVVQSKGTGYIALESAATSIPLVIASGTGLQHSTSFSFANTAIGRTVTFPDADGTVVFSDGITSWTPTFTFANPGDLSVSYATRIGSYILTGNLVTLHMDLVFTPTFTTAAFNAIITGIPFTVASGVAPALGNVIFTGITYPASCTSLSCDLQPGAADIGMTGLAPTGVQTSITTSSFTSGVLVSISISINYFI